LKSPDPCILGSAHQMGTCRMSSDPRKGVVDARGKVWDVEGLYVADASVFPSASGVNPMVTNMGIADYISRGMAEEMGKGEADTGSVALSTKL
jgi:choline dehydrogenase-like flavoprotein